MEATFNNIRSKLGSATHSVVEWGQNSVGVAMERWRNRRDAQDLTFPGQEQPVEIDIADLSERVNEFQQLQTTILAELQEVKENVDTHALDCADAQSSGTLFLESAQKARDLTRQLTQHLDGIASDQGVIELLDVGRELNDSDLQREEIRRRQGVDLLQYRAAAVLTVASALSARHRREHEEKIRSGVTPMLPHRNFTAEAQDIVTALWGVDLTSFMTETQARVNEEANTASTAPGDAQPASDELTQAVSQLNIKLDTGDVPHILDRLQYFQHQAGLATSSRALDPMPSQDSFTDVSGPVDVRLMQDRARVVNADGVLDLYLETHKLLRDSADADPHTRAQIAEVLIHRIDNLITQHSATDTVLESGTEPIPTRDESSRAELRRLTLLREQLSNYAQPRANVDAIIFAVRRMLSGNNVDTVHDNTFSQNIPDSVLPPSPEPRVLMRFRGENIEGRLPRIESIMYPGFDGTVIHTLNQAGVITLEALLNLTYDDFARIMKQHGLDERFDRWHFHNIQNDVRLMLDIPRARYSIDVSQGGTQQQTSSESRQSNSPASREASQYLQAYDEAQRVFWGAKGTNDINDFAHARTLAKEARDQAQEASDPITLRQCEDLVSECTYCISELGGEDAIRQVPFPIRTYSPDELNIPAFLRKLGSPPPPPPNIDSGKPGGRSGDGSGEPGAVERKRFNTDYTRLSEQLRRIMSGMQSVEDVEAYITLSVNPQEQEQLSGLPQELFELFTRGIIIDEAANSSNEVNRVVTLIRRHYSLAADSLRGVDGLSEDQYWSYYRRLLAQEDLVLYDIWQQHASARDALNLVYGARTIPMIQYYLYLDNQNGIEGIINSNDQYGRMVEDLHYFIDNFGWYESQHEGQLGISQDDLVRLLADANELLEKLPPKPQLSGITGDDIRASTVISTSEESEDAKSQPVSHTPLPPLHLGGSYISGGGGAGAPKEATPEALVVPTATTLPKQVAEQINTAPWIPKTLREPILRLYGLAWGATQEELTLVAKAEEWAKASEIPFVSNATQGFAELINGIFTMRDLQTGEINQESIRRSMEHLEAWLLNNVQAGLDLVQLAGGSNGVLSMLESLYAARWGDRSKRVLLLEEVIPLIAQRLVDQSTMGSQTLMNRCAAAVGHLLQAMQSGDTERFGGMVQRIADKWQPAPAQA